MRRLASAFYNPPTYPHPQTGYPWICLPASDQDQVCQAPGLYIYFSNTPQPYPPRLVGFPVEQPVYYIGKSINDIRNFSKIVSSLMVCYMRFPCNDENSDSRPSFSEVALLTMGEKTYFNVALKPSTLINIHIKCINKKILKDTYYVYFKVYL
ncbi:hypothetical protein ACTA71_005966 [Dictyostelium dimigraforme]